MLNALLGVKYPLYQYSLKKFVGDILRESDIEVVDDMESLLNTLNNRPFDLLLIDPLMFVDKESVAIKKILRLHPKLKILIISDQPAVKSAISFYAGVLGYVEKNSSPRELGSAILEVGNGRHFASMKFLLHLIANKNTKEYNPFQLLSYRENEITMLMLEGKSQSCISKQLKICPSTVSTHKSRIFNKLEVLNLVELVGKANEYDISRP